jgi:phosphatidate cytidylyltransferase
MKQRVITALLVTPFAIAIFLLLPTIAFATLIGALCLIALWGWARLSRMH